MNPELNGDTVALRSTARTGDSRVLAIGAPVFLAMSLLLIWVIVTSIGEIEAWVFPTPSAFLERAASLFSQGWFWNAAAVTATEAIAGAGLGTAVAIPLAWLIYRSNLVRAALEPFLGATQAIPAIAIAPLLVLWIGHGFLPVVALCALIVFFPVLVSTVVGLRGMDRDILDAAALDGASGFRLIWSIEMPLAAPVMLAGIRNGFALSVTGAVVGEMVMGGTGLGQTLTGQRYNLDTAGMFVTIAVLCTLAMAAYSCIYAVERRIKRDSAERKQRTKGRVAGTENS